jgi:hypothetical protein
MNFKQFFIESTDNRCVVIRDANEDEIDDINFWYAAKEVDNLIKPIDKGWVVNCKGATYKIFPNYAVVMQPYVDDQPYIMFTKDGRFINYSTDRVPTNILQSSTLKKAIDLWELKKTLSPNTINTFSDVIDEL